MKTYVVKFDRSYSKPTLPSPVIWRLLYLPQNMSAAQHGAALNVCAIYARGAPGVDHTLQLPIRAVVTRGPQRHVEALGIGVHGAAIVECATRMLYHRTGTAFKRLRYADRVGVLKGLSPVNR